MYNLIRAWALLVGVVAAQDVTVIQGTRTQASLNGGIDGLPTTGVSYLDYGTTIVYNTGSVTAGLSQATLSSSVTSGVMSLNLTTNATTTSTTIPQSSALIGTVTQTNNTATKTGATRPTNTVPCNGYPQFCNRKYSNITMVAAHNSPFHMPNNLASNQDFGVVAQLNDGVRLVQGQAHIVNGVPRLCHTSCDILDAGPLEDWLRNITDWLEANPYDVVTVLIGNGNYDPVSNYTSAVQASGIIPLAYVPPQIPMNVTSWPTLGQMILEGKRAVIFMDYQANQTEVPYILDEFSQMSETPFDPVDPEFPCFVERPPDLSNEQARNRMYMVNHNLNSQITVFGMSILIPNISNLAQTNALEGFTSAGLTAEHCISNFTRPPNFINVDYYNYGSPYNGSIFGVAAQQNNVNYNPDGCCGKSQVINAATKLLTPATRQLALVITFFACILGLM